MSAIEKAKQALTEQAPTGRTVEDLIARMAPELERALPAVLGVERFQRLVLTELRRTPALRECVPESLLGAMMLSAQLGLEPGPLGLVYFVPWREKGVRVVQWILGYQGIIELARRSGRLVDIAGKVVYDADVFELVERESGTRLRHVPAYGDRGEPRLYYSRALIQVAARVTRANVTVLTPEEVEAHRRRSPAGSKGEGPWQTDYQAMALKTCVRVQRPWLPLSPDLVRALPVDSQPVAGITPDAEPIVEPAEEV